MLKIKAYFFFVKLDETSKDLFTPESQNYFFAFFLYCIRSSLIWFHMGITVCEQTKKLCMTHLRSVINTWWAVPPCTGHRLVFRQALPFSIILSEDNLGSEFLWIFLTDSEFVFYSGENETGSRIELNHGPVWPRLRPLLFVRPRFHKSPDQRRRVWKSRQLH